MAKQEEFVLRNEKVTIRRIPRFNNGITDRQHPLYGGMLETATLSLAPRLLRNGNYTNILSKEEKDVLEESLGLEANTLSIYNKKYWDNYYIRLEKDDLNLDLKDPNDYIKYKVLSTHIDLIAPSLEEQHRKGSYRYVIIKQNEEEERSNAKISKKSLAYMKLGEINQNKEALLYTLKILTGRIPSTATKLGTLRTKVGELVESDTNNFVQIVDDPDFDIKVFIDNGVRVGAILRRGSEYFTVDNKPMMLSGDKSPIEEAVKYLKSVANQEVKFAIEARIETAKE